MNNDAKQALPSGMPMIRTLVRIPWLLDRVHPTPVAVKADAFVTGRTKTALDAAHPK